MAVSARRKVEVDEAGPDWGERFGKAAQTALAAAAVSVILTMASTSCHMPTALREWAVRVVDVAAR